MLPSSSHMVYETRLFCVDMNERTDHHTRKKKILNEMICWDGIVTTTAIASIHMTSYKFHLFWTKVGAVDSILVSHLFWTKTKPHSYSLSPRIC